MIRLASIAAALLLTAGCIYVDRDDDRGDWDDDPWVNSPPFVGTGYAGCYFDAAYGDDILYFEASVTDPDGFGDVIQVWGDVYDDYTGELVQSFELYPTDDPSLWFSDWLVSTTRFDCFYGGYTVDLVAYDTFDEWDAITIYPDTYR